MNAPFRPPLLEPQPHRFTVDDLQRMYEIGVIPPAVRIELLDGEVPWRFTIDDVYRMQEAGILEEGGPFELIEGEIIDMPSEGSLHLLMKERLARRLYALLSTAYGIIPDGTLGLSSMLAPDPDFYIYPKPGEAYDMRGPDVLLVIEIAVTSQSADLGRKAQNYREHGVREYWVIEPEARVTHVHRLAEAWPLEPPTPFADTLKAQLIPGLEINLAELLARD
jgi:Uma2 family endonuclease